MTDWLDPITPHALADESSAVAALLARTGGLTAQDATIRARAATLISNQRAQGPGSAVESFLQSYGLSTREGIAMLCLAEALLRIPDAATADQLIEDTFATGNWKQHLGQSESTLVNASTWALMLTGSVLELDRGDSLTGWFGGLIKRSGEPVIRQALRAGMKFLGTQFVMGENVPDAIANAKKQESLGYTMSYDILGEGARTDAQAQAYVQSYLTGIRTIAAKAAPGELLARPGISIKLSALHARYCVAQEDRVKHELLPRLKSILRVAKECNIAVSLDAEEANRLELELELYRDLLEDPEFGDFDGIGFVLQAYQKRAVHVAVALRELATKLHRRIPVRLVKGAYWDSEIKYAQMMGLPGYPVFTRKEHTDLSYLACAQELLAAPTHIYPQFATHNALTAATILEIAAAKNVPDTGYEFQRLHGMGESLHDQLVSPEGGIAPFASLPPSASGSPSATHRSNRHRCRIYAPVGAHKDLLAYLIRRLLENGANSSFVHLLLDQATPIDHLTESPIARVRAQGGTPNPLTPLPVALYGPHRKNPEGVDVGYRTLRVNFLKNIAQHFSPPPVGGRLGGGHGETPSANSPPPHPSPAGGGSIPDIAPEQIPAMVTRAQRAFAGWNQTPVEARAAILRRAGDMLEAQGPRFLALCIDEGKKTYSDAVAELREAIDFCRYYANEAERLFAPIQLPGPTGESNVLTLHGRGVFLCISPWNFPLAIFMGQVAAALVAGNSVIAKPAEQTPAIAAAAVALLHEAGVPADALQLAPGRGETVGAALVTHPRIAGVCFTGSTHVAKLIQRALAAKDGPIVPLIAETGGMNAMIVDSSALLEQATDDIVTSAFGSAGQRCSALRMLFVQEEVAQELRDLLVGAMDELRLGSPRRLSTDIAPVIDREAQAALTAHINATTRRARWYHQVTAPADILATDSFVAPTVIGLDDPATIKDEVFGPVLHFFTYKAKELPKLLERIEATGYGLTFGLHTRLRAGMETVLAATPVGNRYVNRSMIGAVVGVQPFGGEGLSGTGPKAGGPYYLLRFASERTTTINTAAIGGNVELLS